MEYYNIDADNRYSSAGCAAEIEYCDHNWQTGQITDP